VIGVKTGGAGGVEPLPGTHQYANTATLSVAVELNCTVIGSPTVAVPAEVIDTPGTAGLVVWMEK
jgi:hypothetical protein